MTLLLILLLFVGFDCWLLTSVDGGQIRISNPDSMFKESELNRDTQQQKLLNSEREIQALLYEISLLKSRGTEAEATVQVKENILLK